SSVGSLSDALFMISGFKVPCQHHDLVDGFLPLNLFSLLAAPKVAPVVMPKKEEPKPIFAPPPPPPPPIPTSKPIPLPYEKVIVEPVVPTEAVRPSTKPLVPQTSVRSYTIASLQQYTNRFSQDNLIGNGTLGSVYRAQLPNGKLLAVKKLDRRVIKQQKEEDFIELVNNLDKIRHANDALHSDNDYKKKFTWSLRIRMALGAARALKYLHDFCEPPVIHINVKSTNILLDEDLSVRVSDCGLAPLISRGVVSQLSGNLLAAFGYGAPVRVRDLHRDERRVQFWGSDVRTFNRPEVL
nr:protein STRUBBELIG-receptor family 3-like isoform X1 [Tanacetum cinerariifolium]